MVSDNYRIPDRDERITWTDWNNKLTQLNFLPLFSHIEVLNGSEAEQTTKILVLWKYSNWTIGWMDSENGREIKRTTVAKNARICAVQKSITVFYI